MEIQNKRIEDGAFQQIRQEVLGQWPTGKEVDLQEAFDFHRQLPESKVFSRKLSQAKREGKTLIQPRAGVALIKEHIELLTYLQDKGEADLLPTTIDSYTRQNRYEDAEKGIVESAKSQKSMLNGLPAVNHGVASCRQIIQSLDIPVQIRHGTPDARLLTEICYAAGFTSYEGGGISYNVPYAKNVPLERTILDWQYCDRLTGLYEEAGIPINREPYGPLTGTLVPPCISCLLYTSLHLRRQLYRPPQFRLRHHHPGAGERRLQGGDPLPAGCEGRCPLHPVRPAPPGLSHLGGERGLDGQPLHRGQKAPRHRLLHRRRGDGQAPRPGHHRLLQHRPPPLSRGAHPHRRGGGIHAPLCPLRLLGQRRSPQHPAGRKGRFAPLRHGGTPDRRGGRPSGDGGACGGHPGRAGHLLLCLLYTSRCV